MTELMQRRRALMVGEKNESWINIIPGQDWTNAEGFVESPLRSITKEMISVEGATRIVVPCPFIANGSYSSWGSTAAGIIIREFDHAGNYLNAKNAWGAGADNGLDLHTGTSYIRIGFQKGPWEESSAVNWTLINPLTVNGESYNTKFNGQEVRP